MIIMTIWQGDYMVAYHELYHQFLENFEIYALLV